MEAKTKEQLKAELIEKMKKVLEELKSRRYNLVNKK